MQKKSKIHPLDNRQGECFEVNSRSNKDKDAMTSKDYRSKFSVVIVKGT